MGAFLLELIRIEHVSKIYKSDNNKETIALDDVSLSFSSAGLIAIIGKSGSGKSTLINLLASLDHPSKGKLFILNQSNNKSLVRKQIGIIFQHYYLLENENVLFNIMLPSLIKGDSKKVAKEKAIKLLESINYPTNLYKSKCADLSGGEKERVALLRALINDPPILLCDEPTGALDSKNATEVMELLKKISANKLVIVVSHNLALTNKYADRIITLKDGKIEKDKTVNKIKSNEDKIPKPKRGHHNNWSSQISNSNFKKRFTRNLISITSLFIGLLFCILILGFSSGSQKAIINNSYRQFDYGVASISSQYVEDITGSKMTLVKEIRPTFSSLEEYNDTLSNYEIENNFDSLIPPSTTIKLGEEKLENFTYHPIYSFSSTYIDTSLLMKGYLPGSDNLNEVVINKKGYEYLSKHSKVNPLEIVLEASFAREFHYYTGEIDNPTVSDVFSYKKYFHITGVVDEMDFLNTPKIYYSYRALVDYLFDYPLNNLSNYLERNISWYERVATSGNNEDISSYSLKLFLKDINDKENVPNHISSFTKPLVMESTPVTLGNTLSDLVKAATMGMEIFLIVALIGTALILGIVSFSSYSEDRKTIAILSTLGAKRDDVMDIYISENIIVSFISLILSFVASIPLSILANKLIYNFTGFDHMISVPFLEISKGFIFLIIILIIATIFLATISTSLPILFSGKISLKKELADE